MKLGPLVSAASGSIGGVTFAQSAGGAVVRRACTKTQSASFAQAQHRARFADVSKLWTSLSSTEKAAWNTAATQVQVPDRLGIPIVKTGRQLLMNLGARLRTAIPTAPYPPPNQVARPFFQHLAIGWVAGLLEIDYVVPATMNDGVLHLYAARSFSLSGFKRIIWTFIGDFNYTAGSSSTWDATSEFSGALGTPPPGELLALKFSPVSEEQLPSQQQAFHFYRTS